MSVFSSILQVLLQIPESYVTIKSFSAEELNDGRNEIVVNVASRRKTGDCPNCGKRTKKTKGKKNHMLILKHMVLSTGDEVCLGLCRRRFRCCSCDISFMEKMPVETGKSYTKLFASTVLKELGRKSILTISEEMYCSQDLIQGIANTVNHEEFNRRGIEYLSSLNEIQLIVDGHSFREHEMVSIIIEHNTGKLVALLSGEKTESFREWAESLPEDIRAKITCIGSDMKTVASRAFEIVTGRKIPQSIDPFHVIQRANKMVDVAIDIHNHLKNLEKKRGRPTKEAKRMRGKKDISNKKIFMIGAEKLQGSWKEKINGLLKKSEFVTESWLLKEQLRESFKEKDEDLFLKTMNECLESEHFSIQDMGKTLRRHKGGILSYLKTGITTAKCEAMNVKAKLIKRIGRGFRSEENYLNRLALVL